MDKYTVMRERECPECHGRKWLTHSAWERFHEETKEKHVTMEDVEKWFRNEGYSYPPDEECLCSECDGQGVIYDNVELVEALRALGVPIA